MIEHDTQLRKQAEYFKALSHPTRIKIIHKLLENEQCVGKIEQSLKASQANISQHLLILRSCGIVDYRIEGSKRCYYLINPEQIRKLLECFNKGGSDASKSQ